MIYQSAGWSTIRSELEGEVVLMYVCDLVRSDTVRHHDLYNRYASSFPNKKIKTTALTRES